MKKYKSGILVGRFQTVHLGHQMMIDTALQNCERVGVFIGSSQESGTEKNPFSYEMRKDLLTSLYGDKIEIYPLPDIGVGNNPNWGKYVLTNVIEKMGVAPELLVTGEENRRVTWFDFDEGHKIDQISVAKSIDISASKMREFFARDDKESFKKYTDPKLWEHYDEMRIVVLQSLGNKETKSM